MIEDRPTVFVVDDEISIRKALDRLLTSKGIRVQSFGSAEEFLKVTVNEKIVCLLLDIHLPGLSGLDLQALLADKKQLFPVVFITGHGDIPMAIHTIQAGAVGFLTKPFREIELMAEIEKAFDICRKQLQQNADAAEIQRCYATLTEREREVLSWVTTGRLNKQTASELGIVENTVKVHRRRVMDKMRAHSLAELVVMVQKLNLPPPRNQHPLL